MCLCHYEIKSCMCEVNESAFYFDHNCGLDLQLNILAIQPENTEL